MALHMTRLVAGRHASNAAAARNRGASSYAGDARRAGMVNMHAIARQDELSQEEQRRQEITRRIHGQFDVSADDHDLGAPVVARRSGGWRMLRGIAAFLTGNGDADRDGQPGNDDAADGSDDGMQALDGTIDLRSLRKKPGKTKQTAQSAVSSMYDYNSSSSESSGGGSYRRPYMSGELQGSTSGSQNGGSFSKDRDSTTKRPKRGTHATALTSRSGGEREEDDLAVAEALGIEESGAAGEYGISGVRGRLRSITERVGGGRRFSTVGAQGDTGMTPELAQAYESAGRAGDAFGARGGRALQPAGVTTRALAQQAEAKRLRDQVQERRRVAQLQRDGSRWANTGLMPGGPGEPLIDSKGPSLPDAFGVRSDHGSNSRSGGLRPESGPVQSQRHDSTGRGDEEKHRASASPSRKSGIRSALKKKESMGNNRRMSDTSEASEARARLYEQAAYEALEDTAEPDDLHHVFKDSALLDSKDVQVGPNCRQRVQHVMIATSFGVGLDFCNALLSLGACFLYVTETYMVPSGNPETKFEQTAETVISWIEISLSIFFALDFGLRLFISEPWYAFFFTWNAGLDLLTIIPVFVTAFITATDSNTVTVLSILALARVFRVLRIVRLYRTFEYIDNEVTKQSVRIGLTIMSLLFVAAGLFQIAETLQISGDEQQLSFFESLWFCVVTITTVGYGDIFPSNDVGRALVIVIILTAFFAIPLETNKLLELLAHQSEYALAYYVPPDKGARESNFVHVLVVGNVHSASIQDFFRELLHPDHSVSVYVVVLHPMPPSDHILDIMAEPEREGRITYIQGSPMHSKDLIRGHIHSADGCFILTNKLTRSPEAEDASAMLTALGIKKHVMAHGAHDINLYMQLIKPESKRHLMATMPPEMSLTVVCTEQLTMNLLSMNVVCPGLNTMLFNLMASDDSGDPMTDNFMLTSGDRLEDQRWYQEYRRGKGFEIYRTSLSKAFALIPFYLAADVVYRQTSAMMFGLELSDQNAEGYEEQIRIILNPGAMPIPAQKGIRVKAFVIASDKATADLVGLGHARAKKDTLSAAANKSLLDLKRKLEDLKAKLAKDKGLRKRVKRARRQSFGRSRRHSGGLDSSALDMRALAALDVGVTEVTADHFMRSNTASGDAPLGLTQVVDVRTSTAQKGAKLRHLNSSMEAKTTFKHPMTVVGADVHQRQMAKKQVQSQQARNAPARRNSGSAAISRQPFTTRNQDLNDRAGVAGESAEVTALIHDHTPRSDCPAVRGTTLGRQFSFGSASKSDSATQEATELPFEAGTGSASHNTDVPGLVPSQSSLGDLEVGGENLQLKNPAGARRPSPGQNPTPGIAGDSLELSMDVETLHGPAPTSQAPGHIASAEQNSRKPRRSRIAVIAVAAGSGSSDADSSSSSEGGAVADELPPGQESVSGSPDSHSRLVSKQQQPISESRDSRSSRLQPQVKIEQPTDNSENSLSSGFNKPSSHMTSIPSDASLRVKRVDSADLVDELGEPKGGEGELALRSTAEVHSLKPPQRTPPDQSGIAAAAGRSLLRGKPRPPAPARVPRPIPVRPVPILTKYNSDDDIGVRIASYRLDHVVARLIPDVKRRVAAGLLSVPSAPIVSNRRRPSWHFRLGERQLAPPPRATIRRRGSDAPMMKQSQPRKRRLSWDPAIGRGTASQLAPASPQASEADLISQLWTHDGACQPEAPRKSSFRSDPSLIRSNTTAGSLHADSFGADSSQRTVNPSIPLWLDLVLEKKEVRKQQGREPLDLWSTAGIAHAHRKHGFESSLPSSLWVQHFVQKSQNMNKLPAMLRAELGEGAARMKMRRQSDQVLQVIFADSQFGASSKTESDAGSPTKASIFTDHFEGHGQQMGRPLALASEAAEARGEQLERSTEDVLRGALHHFGRTNHRGVSPPSRRTPVRSLPGPSAALNADGSVPGRRRVFSGEGKSDAGPSNRMLNWAGAKPAVHQSGVDSVGYGIGSSGMVRVRSDSNRTDASMKPPLPALRRGISAIRSVGRKAAIMASVNHAMSEPARWRRRYYLRAVPSKLQAATLFSVRNRKGFQGHVIISGSVNNLLHIIKPLRSRILSDCVPIVLLHSSPPSEHDWKRISAFQEVYFVQGSALSEEALGRAGIRTAACAIVLSGRDSGVLGQAASNEIEHTDSVTGTTTTIGGLVDKVTLIDSEALFYAQAMLRMQPSLTTVVELMKFSNSVFLKPDVQTFRYLTDDSQTSSSPMFASGAIFSPVLLDVLLCQSFFNPPIVVILEMLVLGAEGSTGRRTGSTDIARGMQTMRGGGAMSTRIFKGKYAVSRRASLGGDTSGAEPSSAVDESKIVSRTKSGIIKHKTATDEQVKRMQARSGMGGSRRTASGKLAPPPPPRTSFRKTGPPRKRTLPTGGKEASETTVDTSEPSEVQMLSLVANEKALRTLGVSKDQSEVSSVEGSSIEDLQIAPKQKPGRRGSILGSLLGILIEDDENDGLLGDDDNDLNQQRALKKNRTLRRKKKRARAQRTQGAGTITALAISSSSSESDAESFNRSSDEHSREISNSRSESDKEFLPMPRRVAPVPNRATARVIPAGPPSLANIQLATGSSLESSHLRGEVELLSASSALQAAIQNSSSSDRNDTQQSLAPASPDARTLSSKGNGISTSTDAAQPAGAGSVASLRALDGKVNTRDSSGRVRAYSRKKSKSGRRRSNAAHKIQRDADGQYLGAYEDESEEEAAYKDKSTLGKLLKRVRRSRVMNIPVPPKFYNKPYHEMVGFLLHRMQIVPLGLYRGVYRTHGIVSAGNEHPYVVTNPNPGCIITAADGVYVLGPIKDLQGLKDQVIATQKGAMGD